MKLNIKLIEGLSDASSLAEDRMKHITDASPNEFITRARSAANKILDGCKEYEEEAREMNEIKERDRNTMIMLDNEGDGDKEDN